MKLKPTNDIFYPPHKGKHWNEKGQILVCKTWYDANDIVLEDSLDARTPDGDVFCICDNCRKKYKPLIPRIELTFPAFHRRHYERN